MLLVVMYNKKGTMGTMEEIYQENNLRLYVNTLNLLIIQTVSFS